MRQTAIIAGVVGTLCSVSLAEGTGLSLFQSQVIAATETSVPGTTNTSFTGMGLISISPSGQVLYGAQIRPNGGANRNMLMRRLPNGQQSLVLGYPLATNGLPQDLITEFTAYVGNADNRFVTMSWSQGASGFAGLLGGAPGNASVIAQRGAVAPGFGSSTYSGFFHFQQIRTGASVVYGEVNDVGGVVWRATSTGEMQPVITQGQGIIGLNSGLYANMTSRDRPIIGMAPDNTVAAVVQLGGPTFFNDRAIVKTSPQGLQSVVKLGSVVTERGTEMAFQDFGSVGFTDNGTMHFWAQVSPNGGGTWSRSLWTVAPGEYAPHLLIKAGDTVTTPTGVAMVQTIGGYGLSDSGRFVINGSVGASPFDTKGAILLGRQGAFSAPLVSGTQIPGMALGTKFLVDTSYYARVFLSNQDTAIVSGYFTGGIAGSQPMQALWCIGENGVPVLMTHAGEQVQIAPGDIRTIARYIMPNEFGYPNAWASAISDREELVYTVQFTDGSMAQMILQVPSPAAFGLVFSVLGVHAARRRRVLTWL